MLLRLHLLLASYIIEARSAEFEWGKWDCNTFIIRWVDKFYGANSGAEVIGKYSSVLQAARFYRKYMRYHEYLTKWGYNKVNDDWRTGDVIIEPNRLWASAHIICGDQLFSMHPDYNLIQVGIGKIDRSGFETWRI